MVIWSAVIGLNGNIDWRRLTWRRADMPSLTWPPRPPITGPNPTLNRSNLTTLPDGYDPRPTSLQELDIGRSDVRGTTSKRVSWKVFLGQHTWDGQKTDNTKRSEKEGVKWFDREIISTSQQILCRYRHANSCDMWVFLFQGNIAS